MKNEVLVSSYETAEKRMPMIFSGNQFTKEMRRMGIPQSIIVNTHHHRVAWLSQYCERVGRKMYQRKSATFKNKELPLTYSEYPMTYEQMITALKAIGCKILKPTTQYEEV